MIRTKLFSFFAIAALVGATGCMNDSATGPVDESSKAGDIRFDALLEATEQAGLLEGGGRFRDRPSESDKRELRLEVGGFDIADFPDAVEGEEPGTFEVELDDPFVFVVTRGSTELHNESSTELAFGPDEEDPTILISGIGIRLRADKGDAVELIEAGDTIQISHRGVLLFEGEFGEAPEEPEA